MIRTGPRVDLPPLDQFGQWPVEAGRFVRRRRRRLDESFENDDAALPYYLDQAQKAWAVADEERTRRLAIEEEFDRCARDYLQRPEPPTRFVERKVYIPMPPKEVIKKITIERTAPRVGPCIVVTPPASVDTVEISGHVTGIGEVPPGTTMTRLPIPVSPRALAAAIEEEARGLFGRLGDRIDRLFRSKRTIHVGMGQ